jgi:hypothetical protein
LAQGFGTVNYTVSDQATGKEETKEYRWNTRSLLLEDLGAPATDPQRKAMLAKVEAADTSRSSKTPR